MVKSFHMQRRFLAVDHLCSSQMRKIFFYFIWLFCVLSLTTIFMTSICSAESISQPLREKSMPKGQLLDSTLFNNQEITPYIRLAILNVQLSQIENFKRVALHNVQSTLNQEDDVLGFYSLSKKDDSKQIFVFEIYKDEVAYKAHLLSPHYNQFVIKAGSMIENKALYETAPVKLARKPTSLPDHFYIRIAELHIKPKDLNAYKMAVIEEIEASIEKEPGVFAIYAVSLKDAPNQLHFLEFYADEQAYQQHRESSHFQKYLTVTKPMIKSLKSFEVESIALGEKTIHSSAIEITKSVQ